MVNHWIELITETTGGEKLRFCIMCISYYKHHAHVSTMWCDCCQMPSFLHLQSRLSSEGYDDCDF